MGDSEHIEHATPQVPEVPVWKLLARKKRAEQFSLIPEAWRLTQPPGLEDLSPKDCANTSNLISNSELEITSIIDARILAAKIASRELTSLQVATAYCKHAAVLQQLTGCLTEIFFDRAFERAKWLDEYLEREGKTIGPLHGVPISWKDNYDIEGVDSTIGWVGLIGKPAKQNSLGVAMVLRLGAIIYVKTNVPQSLMVSGESCRKWSVC